MTTKLKVLGIENAKPGVYHDGEYGLHIEVGAKRKTWYVKYRQGGKQHRPKLGYFPATSLAEARAKAKAISDCLEAGAPVVLIEAAVAEVEHPRTAKVVTLNNLLDQYETFRKIGGGKRIKSLPEALRAMRYGYKDYLELTHKQFGKPAVRAVRADYHARGAASGANRLLSYTNRFMRWAVSEQYYESNFVRDLEKTTEKKRKVFLTDEEIRAVWHACTVLEQCMDSKRATRSFARLIRFLICVPGRRMEGALLRVENLRNGYWVFGDHKTAETSTTTHELLLPPLALAQLGLGHPDLGNGAPDQLCFPGHRHGRPFTGFSKAMGELRTLAGIEKHFTIHDLRRTASTHMQELGIRQEIIDAVLNHAIAGVGGVYMQAQMKAQKAKALELWNNELQRILDNRPKEASNVIVLERDVA